MNLKIDFSVQLSKQLGFLQRSCDSYDFGHKDEAVRIATITRILIHQTKNSTSLLKHLDSSMIDFRSSGEPGTERKMVVLGAADKDGGAHVDSEYDPNYGALRMPEILGTLGVDAGGRTIQIPKLDIHLVTLRQIGYELLNSPDLIALQK